MEVVLLRKAKKDRDYWKQTGNEKIMKRITACRSGDGSCVMVENTSKPDPIMHFYPRDSRRVSGIVVTCILFQVLF